MAGVKAGKKKKKGRYVDPMMEGDNFVRSKPVEFVVRRVKWSGRCRLRRSARRTSVNIRRERIHRLQQSLRGIRAGHASTRATCCLLTRGVRARIRSLQLSDE